MKYRPLDNNSWRVYVDTAEYKTLLDSAPDREARLSQRLMGHSLRVGTTTSVTLDRFNKKYTNHGPIWMLSVEAKDSTKRDSALLPRDVWICEDLVRQIKEFTGVADLDAHDDPTPLFHVSKRTIQNWVKYTAENAAQKTGNEDYLKISSHDYRRYFATHMLYRHNVDAEIVRQLGGWQSPRSMIEYLVLPDDVLAAELGSVGLLGSAADKQPADGIPFREQTALRSLATKIEEGDHTERKRLAEEIAALFDNISGVDLAVAGSQSAAERAAEKVADSQQTSFMQLYDDESGVIQMHRAAKIGYYACVVVASWSASFGGTLA